MKRRVCVNPSMARFGVLLALAIGIPGWAAAQETPATRKPPAPAGDDAAGVHAFMSSFVKAFEARDAKGLAAHWTTEGEYANAQGVTVRGRAALEAAFASYFANTPEVTARVQSKALRFFSHDSAMDEGIVTIQRGPTDTPTEAQYTALLVREQNQWRLALMSEKDVEVDPVEALDWLVGDWVSAAGQGAEIRTTYEWAPNKKFLYGKFTIKEPQFSASGLQVIGVDPETGSVHSWTFEADGGVGEADWRRDGDHWQLDVVATLPDGSTLRQTNIMRRINDDTFTWQSIERLVGDTDMADLPPVKVTRVKPSK